MAVNQGDRIAGMALSAFVCVPMALKAAIKLQVFEIISRCSGAGDSLSAADIAAEIPTANPNAATALERILRILAANSLLTVSYKDGVAAYGLTNWTTSLAPRDGGGASCSAAFLLTANEATAAGLHRLEDAVLEEGVVPFDRGNGMNVFAFAEKEKGYAKVFHDAMSNVSAMVMEEALSVYDGFEKVKEIVDVGGGVGTCLAMIVSKYPHIQAAINFDLPYVVANAPPHPGVTHVGGNMFEAIPKASDTIFMKNILHSWNDDKSVKLLRKCCEALPQEGGKVIAVEFVVPPEVGPDIASLNAITHDILMLAGCAEGKQRTLKEFTRLSLAAGFAEMKNFPVAHGIHLLEFHKRFSSTTA